MFSVIAEDCFGEVVRYLEDQKTILSLLLTSKKIREYFERVNPGCCENVSFQLSKIPHNYCSVVRKPSKPKSQPRAFIVENGKAVERPLKPKIEYSEDDFICGEESATEKLYVHRLSYQPLINDTILLSIKNTLFSDMFPNLRRLDLVQLRNNPFKEDVFRHTPNLSTLTVQQCRGITELSFQNLTQLQSLTVDYSRIYETEWRNMANSMPPSPVQNFRLGDSILQNMKNLETLKIYSCQGFGNEGFSHLSKLRKLKIANILTINEEIFDHVSDKLEYLEIQNCRTFSTSEEKSKEKWKKLLSSKKEDCFELTVYKCPGVDVEWIKKEFGENIGLSSDPKVVIRDVNDGRLAGCIMM